MDDLPVLIHDYRPEYAQYFKSLNEEWISKYFVVEEIDKTYLDHPQENIIDKGGYILFAVSGQRILGCCALVPMQDDIYELSKMAVDPEARGKHVGLLLGQAVIEKAKQAGAKKLFLESNTVLKPAISLYRKLGFKEQPFHSSEYARSNIQMELDLI